MLNESGEEEKEFCLGQCFPQTLTFANRERYEVFIPPNLPLLVQEPLGPEGLAVAPVISFEDLCHDGGYQGVGWDEVTIHHNVSLTEIQKLFW